MNKKILAIGFGIVSILLPKISTAASFSDIYVFGDSFVDNGNVFEVTGNPTSPPYFEGRFSNGPVWVEYLPEQLSVAYNPNNNFAYGGATSGEKHSANPLLPGVLEQIDLFEAANQFVDPNALFVISAGPNDYSEESLINEELEVINAELEQTANNIATAVEELSMAGARNFLVVDIIDYSIVPLNRSIVPESQWSDLKELTDTQNRFLDQSLQELNIPDINIFQFEINSPLEDIISNPQEYGFTNITDPCLDSNSGTICNNPDEYFFWDVNHPSATAHQLIADIAVSQLIKQTTPEASTIPSLLGFLGAAFMLKRRKKGKAQ